MLFIFKRMRSYEFRISDWRSDVCSSDLAQADMGDDFGRHTKFERGLQQVSNNFGVVSLMSPWNSAMKQFSGVLVANRAIEHAGRWVEGEIGKKGMERLASVGIGKTMAARIARQFKQFGADQGRSEERSVGKEWVSKCGSRWGQST